jgi:Ca2+-binding RTX toxin-like protein
MGVSVFDWSWSGLELNTNKETNSADTIDGGAGNDLIVASWGNDTVRGGDGDNLILGLAGNDTLYGGKDRDIIDGDGDARAEETPDAAPGANRCAYDPELPF